MMRMIRVGDHNLWFIESRISALIRQSQSRDPGEGEAARWLEKSEGVNQWKSCAIIIIITRCSCCAQSISPPTRGRNYFFVSLLIVLGRPNFHTYAPLRLMHCLLHFTGRFTVDSSRRRKSLHSIQHLFINCSTELCLLFRGEVSWGPWLIAPIWFVYSSIMCIWIIKLF